MFICFLSLFFSIQVSDACVNVLFIIMFFSLNFSFFDTILFLQIFFIYTYIHIEISLSEDASMLLTYGEAKILR